MDTPAPLALALARFDLEQYATTSVRERVAA